MSALKKLSENPFENVCLNFAHQIEEKEQHYSNVREARWQELKEIAHETDILLDGRRNRKQEREQSALAV